MFSTMYGNLLCSLNSFMSDSAAWFHSGNTYRLKNQDINFLCVALGIGTSTLQMLEYLYFSNIPPRICLMFFASSVCPRRPALVLFYRNLCLNFLGLWLAENGSDDLSRTVGFGKLSQHLEKAD